MHTYALQSVYNIEQNTVVATSDDAIFAYDYKFVFAACSDVSNPQNSLTHTANVLFNTATYMQDPNDPNAYIINLDLNKEYLKQLISNALPSENVVPGVFDGVSTLTTNLSSNGSLGEWLLQIIALKLFGNAGAVAAIINDSEFTSSNMYLNIVNGLADNLAIDSHLVFEQYIKLGKINKTDIDTNPQHFDFSESSFDFPLYLTGQIPQALGSVLQNGSPLITIGSSITNYSYNIPLLLSINGN